MYKAIIYKEFIKTRTALLVAVMALLLGAAYVMMLFGSQEREAGAVGLVSGLVIRNSPLFIAVKWLPVGIGLALALAQYVPEASDRRLKLTLHLPMREWKIILAMCAFGWTFIVSCAILLSFLLSFRLASSLPWPLVFVNVVGLVPWLMASVVAYNFAAGVCIEPRVSGRIRLAVGGVAVTLLYMANCTPAAYSTAVLPLFLLMLASVAVPFLSVSRFKEGAR